MHLSWGELRSKNADKVNELMVKIGKGKRISFHLTHNKDNKWVIVPMGDVEKAEAVEKQNIVLKEALRLIRGCYTMAQDIFENNR